MAYLVLVNGLPGTGKSTLAAKLHTDLAIPCMGKDMLKEFFFDTLCLEGRENSRMLGRAASDMLYILAEEFTAKSEHDLILESAYFVNFARPQFQALVDTYPHLQVLEIYCSTEMSVRRARFQARNDSGERHQGHIDGTDLSHLTADDPEPLDTYAPMAVGPIIYVDTTMFGATEYETLLAEVKMAMKEETND